MVGADERRWFGDGICCDYDNGTIAMALRLVDMIMAIKMAMVMSVLIAADFYFA